MPSLENELALSQLVLEARSNGVRRIQRRLLRDKDGVPRELPISSYSELSAWCDFMFELLHDEDEHVSHERDTLTIRYDKGVAYRVEEERKEREAKEDKWVAAMTHSFMKALCKGEPKTVEPDDDWLLVVWGSLAGKQSVREATVDLFIDAAEHPKTPHTVLLEDMISATWKAMRDLGPVCYAEPSVSTPKQARKHLDAVKRLCLRQDSFGIGLAISKQNQFLLSSSHFKKILSTIHQTGVAMERLPRSYRGKREEDLRDHLLTVLAPSYPNSTGETFNKEGKTDILVRHQGVNIFVGECKFWKGHKRFQEAIDQILRNLTSRDSKAAVVCFVRNKEFKPVLEQIATRSSKHPCFVRLMESKKDKSWAQYEFHLQSDPSANIHLAVLCFHFPPK